MIISSELVLLPDQLFLLAYYTLIACGVLFSSQKLVVKPDQLIKRRGKLGLLKVNADWDGVKQWLTEKRGMETKVYIWKKVDLFANMIAVVS